MSRPPKFPGLQPKFEQALQRILATEALSGSDVQTRLADGSKEFALSAEELGDLRKNFVNYIARAKDAGIIQSGGPWAGYQLVRGPNQAPSSAADPDTEQRPRRPTEAAVHFVATCGLSLRFGALVRSLPTAVDTITWGNADMLMLRGNPSRQRLEDNNLDPDVLKLADSSPECILTSIELKYGLERNRKAWFQAVAEAAANSRWANESFLVHVATEEQNSPVDDEVVSLARSAEVGILELTITTTTENRSALETGVILQAPLRPFLRLAELSGTRQNLLREAHALLSLWRNDVVTFLDVEGAPAKLLSLLRQAIANLRRQASFSGTALEASLRALEGTPRICALYGAALDTSASATDAGTDFQAAEAKLAQPMESLPKNEYDKFLADKCALVAFGAIGSQKQTAN